MNYLNYKFEDTEELINTFDEAPLWSASFGILLLKHLDLKPNMKVLDLGSGAGFPLFELAGRLGDSCKVYGIDSWKNATIRSRQKLKNYGYKNAEVIECSAEKLTFEDNFIDLIVSNLGINNFENKEIVFKECHRVLKQKSKLALTTNLNGHWKEFYKIFNETLISLDKIHLLDALHDHEMHRGDIESISNLFSENGFHVSRHFEEALEMNFLDGSAFLNHHFVKLGWMESWKKLIPKEEQVDVFKTLEHNLNSYSKKNNGLKLTVPMLYLEGEKN